MWYIKYNDTWRTWDILFNRDNYLGYNDIANCNREGLDGGVIESWGSSKNNTWEANAVHDNEVIASGLSLLFADDFSPGLTMTKNIIYNNNCLFGNCAVMMIKSVNSSVLDNIVVDSNFSAVFEVSAYRMPAAKIAVARNILWNVSQSSNTMSYTENCHTAIFNGSSWGNATLRELLSNGDGTSKQRTRLAQYGFDESQLDWPVVSLADNNFARNISWLRSPGCKEWDANSVEMTERPFSCPHKVNSWHSRSYLDYAIDPNSALVTKYGFKGSFNVSEIGLAIDQFNFNLSAYNVRDAQGRIQAEDYDRTENLFTTEAIGIGTVGAELAASFPNGVPPGSWARYDGIDFGDGGSKQIHVIVRAIALAGGVTIRFQLGSPDSSGILLSEVVLPAQHIPIKDASLPNGYLIYLGTTTSVSIPMGKHSLFLVFHTPPNNKPKPADNLPHRFWRIITWPSDFNSSFYNKQWDVCSIELKSSSVTPNLATNPANAIASSGNASKAFNGRGHNCTQWDGKMGSNSDFWTPAHGDPHDQQWIGYDFGEDSPVLIQFIRLKQFPNQYCAATPSLQYSDNGLEWTTKFRMQCSSECPNNATGAEPNRGWIQSPGPGTVAPPRDDYTSKIGGVVDWFSFSVDG